MEGKKFDKDYEKYKELKTKIIDLSKEKDVIDERIGILEKASTFLAERISISKMG